MIGLQRRRSPESVSPLSRTFCAWQGGSSGCWAFSLLMVKPSSSKTAFGGCSNDHLTLTLVLSRVSSFPAKKTILACGLRARTS